jgi:hypothetical protein
MIVGQNSLLNQYVPTFLIKDIVDGQMLRYDSTRKAFINVSLSGGPGATKLGELSDVSSSVDNPLSLQNGQALIYNNLTTLWENKFVDFNTLLNQPTSADYTFAGLSDTPSQTGNAGKFLTTDGSALSWATVSGTGTVTSVSASGGTTGLNFTGGPITTSGTLTLAGTLNISNGGTGATTANAALNALLPSQTGNSGRFLTTNGTNTSWVTVAAGSGTVTSVGIFSGNAAITVTNTPITTSGNIIVTANQFTSIAPGFVPASGGGTTNFLRADGTWIAPTGGAGTVTSVTVNGTSGRITSSGSPITSSGSITVDLATSGVTANTYGSSTQVPVLTVDAYGRVTSVTNTTISINSGTVTSVAASGNNGITVSGSPITTSGTITLGLGAITPTSVNATGTVAGSNLSGTNTGDQTITLTGDVTGSGTNSFATTLSNTGVTANTYGSSTQVPVFTVDAKGRISNVTNTTILTGANDPEIVVFRYSAGASGNLSAGDAIFSQTSGVTATIIDGPNCIVSYSFTGKTTPPKSITVYGQIFSTNNFRITAPYTATTTTIAGGGINTAPDIANGIFSAANTISIQSRPSDTGASGAIGQRAWLMVVFGF